MKKTYQNLWLMLLLVMALVVASCEEDEPMPEEEIEEEEVTALESWIMIDADSFFVTRTTVFPAGNGPFRYQVNFGSREQLSQQNNDGETQSTLAIGFAFESRPTSDGTFNFTDDRFTIAQNEVNLYVSFFTGTDHPYAEQNFLSPASGSVDVVIAEGKLTSELGSLTLTNEADASSTVSLQWFLNLDW